MRSLDELADAIWVGRRRDISGLAKARCSPVSGPVGRRRLQDGAEMELSRRRMQGGVQQALRALEAEGCDAILLLCTGTFDGLQCNKAWLVEPDHIIPAVVAGLIEKSITAAASSSDRSRCGMIPIRGRAAIIQRLSVGDLVTFV
jgi:hypothetical protein